MSLKISDHASYRGAVTQQQRDAVKTALEDTRKITIFPLTVYSVGPAGGTNYSVSLSPLKEKTIYYFDHSLGDSCNAVSAIVSAVVDGMKCEFFQIQSPSDPDINIQRDFLTTSGLAMEIVL